jgi:hypothetical protein
MKEILFQHGAILILSTPYEQTFLCTILIFLLSCKKEAAHPH